MGNGTFKSSFPDNLFPFRPLNGRFRRETETRSRRNKDPGGDLVTLGVDYVLRPTSVSLVKRRRASLRTHTHLHASYPRRLTVTVSASEEETHYAQSTSVAPLRSRLLRLFASLSRDKRNAKKGAPPRVCSGRWLTKRVRDRSRHESYCEL